MNSLQRGGFTTGLVVGLVAGLAVALAVALYITKAPVPFVNKAPQHSPEQDAAEAERNKHWDPNAPLAGKNPAKPQPVATAPAGGASAADTGLLPPGIAPAPQAPAAVAQRPPAAPAGAAASAVVGSTPRAVRDPAAILSGQADPPPAAAPPKVVAKAASAPVAAFFVQAGAYTRQEDAEAQRARLALLDLNARISEREQAGRTVYRVRLGPFDGRTEAEDAQGKLSGAGIDANLVRVER